MKAGFEGAWRRNVTCLALLAVLAPAAAGCAGDQSNASEPSPRAEQPNIIVVMTDDQEVRSLGVMPMVTELLVERGTTFANAFASYPLCCPSRATFQTGQYAHNHGVLANKAPKGGYPAFDATETLPVWLGRSGYETAHVGKYLNDYLKTDEVPPGWDRWFGLVEPSSRYFKPHVNDQGTFTKFGETEPEYSTDLFTDQAIDFIADSSETGDPFYLSVGYVAPHVGKSLQPDGGHCDGQGPEPAPRHLGDFQGRPLPITPSFNEDDVSDKPASIRASPKLRGDELLTKTDKYQCRLESLLAVDEGVGQIVSTLEEAGELDNTYLFYVSDNGFVQGQHRIKGGKAVPYEAAIRIPMIVRGPGVTEGEVASGLVSNVDVAPTILELTGAEPFLAQDGHSFERTLGDPEANDGQAILIESEAEAFAGIRTARYLYVERDTGESELYDLRKDPDELLNNSVRPAYAAARVALSELLDRLRTCAGAECATQPDLTLEANRIASEAACSAGSELRISGPDAGAVATARIPAAQGQVVAQAERMGGAGPWLIGAPSDERVNVTVIAELLDGRVVRLLTRLPSCG